jgi:hypothetical protein
MNLKAKFLAQIEFMFKIALGNESWDQGVQFMKKTSGKKLSWHYPIKVFYSRKAANFYSSRFPSGNIFWSKAIAC